MDLQAIEQTVGLIMAMLAYAMIFIIGSIFDLIEYFTLRDEKADKIN